MADAAEAYFVGNGFMIDLIKENADAWHSGNAERGETVTFVHEGFQHGSITPELRDWLSGPNRI